MPVSLSVIVVGGGICGLATAVALKRVGHNVAIYERYSENVEPGAGVVIGSNGVRVLRQWNLDADAYGMTKQDKGYIVDSKTAKILKQRYPEEAERAGESRRLTTREDLRDILRDEIARPTKDGEGQVEFTFGTKIQDYDPDRTAVQLPDGTWKTADLVIACDGIKSRAAHYVVGEQSPAKPIGDSAFRLAIPTAQLQRSTLVNKILEGKPGTIWFCRDAQRRVLVWWPAHFDEVQCFDICLPDNDEYASTEQWLAKCDKSVLLKEFAEWHPVFRDILELADEPLLWKICAREPATKLHEGKLVVLGDALHAMPPYRGQGATMAIEDAAALEICLSEMQNIEELSARLKLFEKLRLPRITAAQLSSNMRFDVPNEDEAWRPLFKRLEGSLPEGDHHALISFQSFTDWLLKYDARHEAKTALEDLNSSNGSRS